VKCTLAVEVKTKIFIGKKKMEDSGCHGTRKRNLKERDLK
jgi:hypothetical protein